MHLFENGTAGRLFIVGALISSWLLPLGSFAGVSVTGLDVWQLGFQAAQLGALDGNAFFGMALTAISTLLYIVALAKAAPRTQSTIGFMQLGIFVVSFVLTSPAERMSFQWGVGTYLAILCDIGLASVVFVPRLVQTDAA